MSKFSCVPAELLSWFMVQFHKDHRREVVDNEDRFIAARRITDNTQKNRFLADSGSLWQNLVMLSTIWQGPYIVLRFYSAYCSYYYRKVTRRSET